jgi:tRNA threonylcarbamoyladenosine biosynthesis protein TsaE
MLRLGAEFAREAAPGMVIRLVGPLGAGKTTFARGFIRALGYDGEVRSPTFNLVQEYDTHPPVCHVDLYRLDGPEQVADLGLQDYLASHTMLVEWAERAASLLPDDCITVDIQFSEQGREVSVS